MTALIVRPLPYAVISANQNALYPASNPNLDEPGLVWRSNDLVTVNVIIDLGANAVAYDTVAVIGSNLRTADTVQVRTGTTNTGIGNYAGSATASFTGNKPSSSSTKSIYSIGARTERYLRLDFVATAHPDGFVSVQRIVVGQSVVADGISAGAKQGFVDQSVMTTGPGYIAVDPYPVLPTLTAQFGWVADSAWRAGYIDLLQRVGKQQAILLVPDNSFPANFQTDAIFGRITSQVEGQRQGFDMWTLEITVQALAA